MYQSFFCFTMLYIDFFLLYNALQPSLLKGSEIPSPSLQDTRPGSWYRKYKCIKVFFCFTMLTFSVMPHPLHLEFLNSTLGVA